MTDEYFSKYPKYYSYITYRPERFGALVFNPYTSSELNFTPEEAEIAVMINGALKFSTMCKLIEDKMIISPFEAEERVDTVIKRLKGIGAVRFCDEPGEALKIENHCDAGELFLSSPKSAIWDVTYLCNLSCPHCLTSSGHKRDELDTKEAMRLVDELSDAKLLYLSLSGGEPFLRPDIVEIIKYSTEKNIRTDIASNGVLIKQDILKKLRDLPVFQIQLSIDGIGQSHDAFRGRRGAFDEILSNIDILKEEGISVSISTTATTLNIGEIESIIDLAAKKGCVAYKAIPFLPAGRGKENRHLSLSPDQHMSLARILFDKSREYEGIMKVTSETTFAFLLSESEVEPVDDGKMGCAAGHDTISIGADGTLYPCPFLHEHPLGNILLTPLREVWRRSPVLNELRSLKKKDMASPCSTCRHAAVNCCGGCRAAAYNNTGSFSECDPLCPAVHGIIGGEKR